MSMTFTTDGDAAGPTHRLVARNLPGVDDWDDAGSVTVENRAMATIMDYGTAVHLQLDSNHGRFETVQRGLTRVPESERVFVGSAQQYRASLPEDRALVESVLDVPDGDTDAWSDRLFSIVAFAVWSDESWLYRSVPHEAHVREIDATKHEELLAELNETVDHVRGSAVVPIDGVVSSWTNAGVEYELQWNSVRRDSAENGHDVYDLEQLRYVTANYPDATLRLDWEFEDSLARRTWRRISGSGAAAPPNELGLPDEERTRALLDAFRQLREDLDYQYEVDSTCS